MDDVSQKYRALLEAAQGLLTQHAYDVNGVVIQDSDREKTLRAFEDAASEFASTASTPAKQKANGAVEPEQEPQVAAV